MPSKSQRDIKDLQESTQAIINQVNHLTSIVQKMSIMVAGMHQIIFADMYDENGKLKDKTHNAENEPNSKLIVL